MVEASAAKTRRVSGSAAKRDTSREEEQSNCTQILPLYKSYSRTSVDNYLTQRHMETQLKMQRLKEDKAERERRECSGRPAINENSRKMA